MSPEELQKAKDLCNANFDNPAFSTQIYTRKARVLLPKLIEEIELLQNFGVGSQAAYIAALERKLKEFISELAWYADEKNWVRLKSYDADGFECSHFVCDGGKRARETLKGK